MSRERDLGDMDRTQGYETCCFPGSTAVWRRNSRILNPNNKCR